VGHIIEPPHPPPSRGSLSSHGGALVKIEARLLCVPQGTARPGSPGHPSMDFHAVAPRTSLTSASRPPVSSVRTPYRYIACTRRNLRGRRPWRSTGSLDIVATRSTNRLPGHAAPSNPQTGYPVPASQLPDHIRVTLLLGVKTYKNLGQARTPVSAYS